MLVNLSDIQKYMLDQENKVSNILLFIKQIDQAEIIIKQIKTTPQNLEIHSWREFNPTFAQVLGQYAKNIHFIIICLDDYQWASFPMGEQFVVLVSSREIAILQARCRAKYICRFL